MALSDERKQPYFIQNEKTRLIKIGHSCNPLVRCRKLQTGSDGTLWIVGLLSPDDGWTERSLHFRFADHRARGEWFNPAIQLRAFIVENTLELPFQMPPLPPLGTDLPMRVWEGAEDWEYGRLRIDFESLYEDINKEIRARGGVTRRQREMRQLGLLPGQ